MTDDLSDSQLFESYSPNPNRGATSPENAHRRICYSHLAHPFDAAALDGLEPLGLLHPNSAGFPSATYAITHISYFRSCCHALVARWLVHSAV